MTAASVLAGHRALVTGGARRLGRETALALAQNGCHVAVHHHASADAAEVLCREMEALGGRAFPIRSDLDDPESLEPLFEAAWSQMGGLDLLVNNASIFPSGRLDQMEMVDLLQNLRVNAWAPFVLTRAFWRKVRGTGGRGSVVNLLDTRLVGGDMAHAPYHLSKVLLAEITSLTALEFAPELQVNGVAPGAVLPPEGHDDAYLDSLTRELPLRRRGYPQDVADAVVYLLGSAFVTGQVLFVDGGRHLRLGGST